MILSYKKELTENPSSTPQNVGLSPIISVIDR